MATTANVTVTILKAESLIPLNPGGTSNPYVSLTLGQHSARTPVSDKTLNPTFHDSTFRFNGCSLPTVLTLSVLNRLPFVDVEDPLGTATVTLFDPNTPRVEKTIMLSHGGSAALAQRAASAGEKGCGSITIAYTLEETASSPVSTHPAYAFPASSTSSSPAPIAVPLPVPAAANISGPAAAQAPTAGTRSSQGGSSGGGTPTTPAEGAASRTPESAALKPSNPSATNPAARSPKIGRADLPPQPALLPSNLTPPSLAPARPPASLGHLVASTAAAAPNASNIAFAAGAPGVPGYVSLAVRGVRASPPAQVLPPSVATVSGAAPGAGSSDFYANNGAAPNHSIAVPPVSAQPLLSSASSSATLPTASAAPSATRPNASSLDVAMVARSSNTSSRVTPSSSMYTTAMAAPAVAVQPLLVVPPHIGGTPDAQQTLDQRTFPSQPPSVSAARESPHSRPTSTSAAVVATAPRPQPWGASNSRGTTPSSSPSLSVQGNSAAAAALAPRRQQQQQLPLPAGVTRCRSGEDMAAVEAGAARTTSKNRQERRHTDAAVRDAGDRATAETIYADPQYLFANAASGHDVTVFARLREADPYLSYGFLDCRDHAGRTLLHLAAWNGQLGVLRALLNPPSACARQTAGVAQAASDPARDDALAASLLRHTLSYTGGNTVLHAAAMGGQREVVTWLSAVMLPADFEELKRAKNERGRSPAEAAQESGFHDVASMLL